MTAPHFASYQLDISTLGAVHIGTGYDLDPTNYVIDGATLYEFSVDALMAVFDQEGRAELHKRVSNARSGTLVRQVQRLIQARSAQLKPRARLAMPVSPGVDRLYRERMQNEGGPQNALEIQRMVRDARTGAPVLPGSSLKGAMRTALLNQQNQGSRSQERSARALEQSLLQYREFHQDPMRLVQVSDAAPADSDPSPRTRVVFAVNRKKEVRPTGGRSRPSAQAEAARDNLYQMLEVIAGRQGRAFSGRLTLYSLDAADKAHRQDTPQSSFDAQRIAAACNGFYLPLWRQERALLSERKMVDARWLRTADQYVDIVQKNADRAFLLRVGRHSGAEAVTIEGARDIRIMQGPGRRALYGDASTTLWLSSDQIRDQSHLIPFGWIVVGFQKI